MHDDPHHCRRRRRRRSILIQSDISCEAGNRRFNHWRRLEKTCGLYCNASIMMQKLYSSMGIVDGITTLL